MIEISDDIYSEFEKVGENETSADSSRTSQAAIDHSLLGDSENELHTTRYLDHRFGCFCRVSACEYPRNGECNQRGKKDECGCGSSQACSGNVELPENREQHAPVA